jgi:IS30 family transposase
VVAELFGPAVESATDKPSFAGEVSDQPGMWLCHESIYLAIHQARSGLLRVISTGFAPSLSAAHRARSPARSAAHLNTVHDAFKLRMADLPAALLRSITWD